MLNPRNTIRLAGTVSLLGYAAIYLLSQQFGVDTKLPERPILVVLSLFAVVFAAYLFALWQLRADRTSVSWREVFLWGLVFRTVLWPSLPIQEVDLYRYVWDGAVSQAGVDPYQFPPQQIVSAVKESTSAQSINDPDLRRLVRIYQDRAGLRQVADKVHFAFLTTPYPPVSQAVFAFTHAVCPSDASEFTFTVAFKAVMLLFDAATALVLMELLRFLGYSRSVVLAYWWCPLVIKEFANSGHLDSIAVFFVTASMFLLLKACFPPGTPSAPSNQSHAAQTWTPFGYSLGSAVLLAFGVGAKLFPLVLAPLWAVALLRRRRWAALLPIMVFGATTLIVCWPMVARTEFMQDRLTQAQFAATAVAPQPEIDADTPSGIEAFYRYWEMNDLLFLIVVENLKPTAQLDGQPPAWFVVTSEPWRTTTHRAWQARLNIAENEVAFVLTRWLLSGVFLIVVIGVCVSVLRNATAEKILTGSFLTIAWLWLLGPAQNPWYWTWAIPFLPFVRNRAWIAVSGLAFLYYLRFWFEGHFAETTVLSTPYTGLRFFDFVVPWIEFGPWFFALLILFFRETRANAIFRTQHQIQAGPG